MIENEASGNNGIGIINGDVNAPININTEKSSKAPVDVRKAATQWFESVEGLWPIINGHFQDESKAVAYEELKKSFVDHIDREYDELPPKKILYQILDELKQQMSRLTNQGDYYGYV